MAAGLRKGEGRGASEISDLATVSSWGGSFHGPPPATCWMTIWGSGKAPQQRQHHLLSCRKTTTKVKKSVSLIWRGGGRSMTAACCCCCGLHLSFKENVSLHSALLCDCKHIKTAHDSKRIFSFFPLFGCLKLRALDWEVSLCQRSQNRCKGGKRSNISWMDILNVLSRFS